MTRNYEAFLGRKSFVAFFALSNLVGFLILTPVNFVGISAQYYDDPYYKNSEELSEDNTHIDSGESLDEGGDETAPDFSGDSLNDTDSDGAIGAPTNSNIAPVANAGVDLDTDELNTIRLDGTSTNDEDGYIVTYNWEQIDGFPNVFLTDLDTAHSSFSAPEVDSNQELNFRLTVTDNGGNIDTDTVKVIIHDVPTFSDKNDATDLREPLSGDDGLVIKQNADSDDNNVNTTNGNEEHPNVNIDQGVNDDNNAELIEGALNMLINNNTEPDNAVGFDCKNNLTTSPDCSFQQDEPPVIDCLGNMSMAPECIPPEGEPPAVDCLGNMSMAPECIPPEGEPPAVDCMFSNMTGGNVTLEEEDCYPMPNYPNPCDDFMYGNMTGGNVTLEEDDCYPMPNYPNPCDDILYGNMTGNVTSEGCHYPLPIYIILDSVPEIIQSGDEIHFTGSIVSNMTEKYEELHLTVWSTDTIYSNASALDDGVEFVEISSGYPNVNGIFDIPWPVDELPIVDTQKEFIATLFLNGTQYQSNSVITTLTSGENYIDSERLNAVIFQISQTGSNVTRGIPPAITLPIEYYVLYELGIRNLIDFIVDIIKPSPESFVMDADEPFNIEFPNFAGWPEIFELSLKDSRGRNHVLHPGENGTWITGLSPGQYGLNMKVIFYPDEIIAEYFDNVRLESAIYENSTRDTDGDGFYDVWETKGIDINTDGMLDLNLSQVGANPLHKDIFVEIDYMKFHKPNEKAVEDVIKSFSEAPIANPDGKNGITLHVIVDEEIAHINEIDWSKFNSVKATHLGTKTDRSEPNFENLRKAKLISYHYAVFGHSQSGTGSSGVARLPGMDFMVTLGSPGWGEDMKTGHTIGSIDQQKGTLMHELGHNLGLRHGGDENENCKPNYLSIMSYTRQFSNYVGNRPLDYSRSQLLALNEQSLDEPKGISESVPSGLETIYGPFYTVHSAGSATDWNEDGDTVDSGVKLNINYFPFRGCDTQVINKLGGHNDWENMNYKIAAQDEASSGGELITDEQTIEQVRKSRTFSIYGLEYQLRNIDARHFNDTVHAATDKAHISKLLVGTPSSVNTLVQQDELDDAIFKLKLLKGKMDESIGGRAGDDVIVNRAAQKGLIPIINNLILSLEKQK